MADILDFFRKPQDNSFSGLASFQSGVKANQDESKARAELEKSRIEIENAKRVKAEADYQYKMQKDLRDIMNASTTLGGAIDESKMMEGLNKYGYGYDVQKQLLNNAKIHNARLLEQGLTEALVPPKSQAPAPDVKKPVSVIDVVAPKSQPQAPLFDNTPFPMTMKDGTVRNAPVEDKGSMNLGEEKITAGYTPQAYPMEDVITPEVEPPKYYNALAPRDEAVSPNIPAKSEIKDDFSESSKQFGAGLSLMGLDTPEKYNQAKRIAFEAISAPLVPRMFVKDGALDVGAYQNALREQQIAMNTFDNVWRQKLQDNNSKAVTENIAKEADKRANISLGLAQKAEKRAEQTQQRTVESSQVNYKGTTWQFPSVEQAGKVRQYKVKASDLNSMENDYNSALETYGTPKFAENIKKLRDNMKLYALSFVTATEGQASDERNNMLTDAFFNISPSEYNLKVNGPAAWLNAVEDRVKGLTSSDLLNGFSKIVANKQAYEAAIMDGAKEVKKVSPADVMKAKPKESKPATTQKPATVDRKPGESLSDYLLRKGKK